jgi:S-adenosylhomocysteine hydrolase
MLSAPGMRKLTKDAGFKMATRPMAAACAGNSLTFYRRSFASSLKHSSHVTDLPTLQSLVDVTKTSSQFRSFENTLFVCVQHGLSSTIDLVKCLVALGAKPHNIFWLGKPYSNNAKVVQEIKEIGVQVKANSKQTVYGGFDEVFAHDVSLLWNQVGTYYEQNHSTIHEVIILDDGGKCLRATPHNLLYRKNLAIVGIEQTSSGINGVTKYYPLPIVNVAGSALKDILETPLIAEATKAKSFKELEPYLEGKNSISVIGFGKVGKAIAKMFANAGHQVFVYDPGLKDYYLPIHDKIRVVSNIGQACAAANIIIGCTGVDISAGDALQSFLTGNDKVLLSCSSRDVEFKTLLETVQAAQPLQEDVSPHETITYNVSSSGPVLKILSGGFPINFDGSPDSVNREHIQGTRAALLGASIYARHLADLKRTAPGELVNKPGSPNLLKLPAVLQQFIKDKWLPCLPQNLYSHEDLTLFADPEKIKQRSIGKDISHELCTAYYAAFKQPQVFSTCSYSK